MKGQRKAPRMEMRMVVKMAISKDEKMEFAMDAY